MKAQVVIIRNEYRSVALFEKGDCLILLLASDTECLATVSCNRKQSFSQLEAFDATHEVTMRFRAVVKQSTAEGWTVCFNGVQGNG
jgi:hypothetical protein